MPHAEKSASDPFELLLRGIVSRTLRRSLLSGALGVVACGSSDESVQQDTTPTAQENADGAVPQSGTFDPCTGKSGFPASASGLSPATPYDYVAIRLGQNLRAGVDVAMTADTWTSDAFSVESETGTACKNATDPKCASTVLHHPDSTSQKNCPQACLEVSVVTTHGNSVQRWDSPAELLVVLGSIDTADDAQLLAASHEYDVFCPSPDYPWADPKGADFRQVKLVEGGYELYGTRYIDTCPVAQRRFRLFVSTSGEVRELDSKDFSAEGGGVCIGRVPAGLRSRSEEQGTSPLGDHLAHCAHLEAASVYAFVRLARELRAHGAPSSLVERALAAAADEVRHARVVAALALAHGGRPVAPHVDELPTRSLEALAHENAVEGCVRETYGALVGAYQAERATDPAIRQAMQRIALDEARHAALSHDVHRWASEQLDADASARLTLAQHEALRALFQQCAQERAEPWTESAGLPSADVACELISGLSEALWSLPLVSARA